jgi:serine/threonine protein kinase
MDEDGHPRIYDFGLAFIIEPSNFTSIKTAGACRWQAPEILSPPEGNTNGDDSLALFTKESDIYAFAMILIEVNHIIHDALKLKC